MNAQQWQRAKEIFDAALRQPQAERAGFVMNACSDDPDLIAEVLDLLEADAHAGSFLDTPVVDLNSDPHPSITPVQLPFDILHAGEMISGRFQIGRFLGQGGMGQVYEARDIELGICVALKTIRPEISSDEHMLARFKKEVHLTRRVTHPNVCRVYDIGRHTPIAELGSSSSQAFAFLTMELLEGETLSDLLRRKGKLATSETLPIAEQVADGLTAAHRLGIVHRDIKPSNILLVPSGNDTRVVVTDFGLARSVTAEGSDLLSQSSRSLTGQGRVVGTLAYMAPEQLTGAEITPATDIYALGLVLYEMVTGTRVFDPNLPFGGIAQRLDRPPVSPRLKAPELDGQWESAIVRCLQVDPAARFQSAAEVVEAIKLRPSRKPVFSLQNGAERGAINRKPVARSHKTKIGTFLIAALLAVALMGVAFRLYEARVKIPEGSSMLLTEIDNETQDPELNAVSDVLRTQLSQSERFDLVDRGKIHDTLGRMGKPYRQDLEPAVAREVAWRIGSKAVVYGSVTKVGPGFSLDLRLERLPGTPASAPVARYKSFPANDKKDLFRAIQEGSRWVREATGDEQLGNDRPPQDTTTASWQALLLFSRAEQLKSIENTDDAVRTLQEAVKVDPQFALAYMRLGDLSNYLGNERDGMSYWRQALAVMKPGSLTQREELRIRGLYAADSGDYKKARGYFQSWEVFYPRDYLPSFYLAGTLISEGRYSEAIDKLNEAEKKQPTAWYVAARRARCRIAIGQLDMAKDDLQRLKQLGQLDTVTMLEGSLAFLRGDYDVTLSKFNELSSSGNQNWKSLSYSLKASLFGERADYPSAISSLTEGINFDRSAGRLSFSADKKIALAYIYYRKLDFANCRSYALSAVADESGVNHLQAAGSLLARCNAPADAERLLHILQNSGPEPVFEIARDRVEGEILQARNKPVEAVQKFRAAAALEDVGAPKEYLARALTFIDKQAAAAEYKKIIDSPGQIWQEPELEWPGVLADCQKQFRVLKENQGPPLSHLSADEKYLTHSVIIQAL